MCRGIKPFDVAELPNHIKLCNGAKKKETFKESVQEANEAAMLSRRACVFSSRSSSFTSSSLLSICDLCCFAVLYTREVPLVGCRDVSTCRACLLLPSCEGKTTIEHLIVDFSL